MEFLGDALKWAGENGEKNDQSLWNYYLAVWLAGRGQFDESINNLKFIETDWSYALLGKLLRVIKQDFVASREAFRKISSSAWNLHPQVFIERDITLSHFGASVFQEREDWFAKVESLQDDGIVERKASFLFDKGEILEAKTILEHYVFEKVNQRYERSHLWQRIAEALGSTDSHVPIQLGEDDLATYGSYRVSGNLSS